MVLLGSVQHAIGRARPECLNHALGVICEHFENGGRINSRPRWLSLIESLPTESLVATIHAEAINASDWPNHTKETPIFIEARC
jgi:hypothetical protein